MNGVHRRWGEIYAVTATKGLFHPLKVILLNCDLIDHPYNIGKCGIRLWKALTSQIFSTKLVPVFQAFFSRP